jgi:hypothetical protein
MRKKIWTQDPKGLAFLAKRRLPLLRTTWKERILKLDLRWADVLHSKWLEGEDLILSRIHTRSRVSQME